MATALGPGIGTTTMPAASAPATSATPGSLMSYGVAKMVSRNPKEFGQGHPGGVAAPESAN